MSYPPRDPRVLRALEHSLLPLLAHCERLSSTRLEAQLAGHGISLAQFRVIGMLLGQGRGLSQRELADRLRVEPATISVALAKLEAAGLVERLPDPSDARAKRVRCAAVIPQLGAVLGVVKDLERIATRGVSDTELSVTRRVLATIIDNLREPP